MAKWRVGCMGRYTELRLGTWGVDFWLMGAVLGKLGLEHLALCRMPKRWMEEVDGYDVSFRKGMQDANTIKWDDVSDELVMLRRGCERTFDNWVRNRIGDDGLAEVLAAIGRRQERRKIDAMNRKELLLLIGEMDQDRKDAEDVMAKRQKETMLAGVVANGREPIVMEEKGEAGGCARVWAVFVRHWDRVIGCRLAVGPDLVGQGDMIKIRVRRGSGQNFTKDGLLLVRVTPVGWEFNGPYFKERVSHARWSAAKRREWKRKIEDMIDHETDRREPVPLGRVPCVREAGGRDA
jgi:hypothetical protein